MSARRRGIADLPSRGALLFTAFLLHAMLAVTALGQEYRGLIIGSVTDPTGAVISKATITAKGPQQTYTTTTSTGGTFSIPYVQPGTYDVTAEAKGFKKSCGRA